jgi:transcriptional regulator with XRE-family HTH domain
VDRAAPRTRRVIVVDNSHVARRVGERIKVARTRTGMTQAQLAQGRYTAAYISALERGLAKPSMAALTFIAERLGVAVPDLVAEERPVAGRLEADLLLAAGKPREALDRYDELLDAVGDDRRLRAEVQRGRAEALCRLDRAADAVRPAAEAAELFEAMGSPADAAWARYWLAGAHYLADNVVEAQSIYLALLAADRAGLEVAPDFRFRLLTQLGNTEAWDGDPERALTYMEEARVLIGNVSLRQRAAFLSGLSLQYRRAGDLERSIRTGHESLALYHAADAEREEAVLENNLAITFVELGNLGRARAHLERARELAVRHDDALLLSEVAEAEAQLALAESDIERATERATAALHGSEVGGSYLVAVGAHRTLARVALASGDRAAADAAYAAAAELLRSHRGRRELRDLLAEWAELKSEWGDVASANQLYAEALGRRPSRS